MAQQVFMPKMSDTMEEGVIAQWLKKVGDKIKSGDVIAEVETDKATMELEAYEDGVLLYVAVENGGSVPVDGLLYIVGEAGEAYDHLLSPGVDKAAAPATAPKAAESSAAPSAQVDTSNIKAELVRMPKMSDTMEEGIIAQWLKKVGDKIKSGDVIAEVETDKATMELEAYEDGVLLYVAVENGGSVPVDAPLYIVGEAGANYQALLQGASVSKSAPAPAVVAAASPSPATATATHNAATTTPTTTEGGRVKISPLAKAMAEERGYDIRQIKGSGDHGRIVKRDVETFQPVAGSNGQASQGVMAAATAAAERYEDKPVSQMRKTIARRLSESKFQAPHFYLTMEIRMDAAMEARTQLNAVSPTKISFNDLVVKASAMALRKHPAINAAWLGDKIRYYQHVHVGVAVAVDEGLLVPVVRFTDTRSLAEIAEEVKSLAQRAKDKKLQPTDWEGNTFAVSNLGMFGIDEFTAIINPPNACILAVGGIKQTPVVDNGQLAIGHVMKVTLSCDHRVVDGASGAAFLQTLKELLEAPVRMLI
ncbi:pyruvate dehydrogenase complex dihydrolipoamide acetyltransferase [Eisenibacter elegans]|uniref:pyruvate dehydrogenase complex dihydrolipoamide acetyltransferase n=1 Tax=Eisenibacter elegans TaxID=997 RepID=UPI00040B3428|nr:pyruvate dehydrogenase complex dihydrolipoamide acetyltransferase [Eisenibacter elegans]